MSAASSALPSLRTNQAAPSFSPLPSLSPSATAAGMSDPPSSSSSSSMQADPASTNNQYAPSAGTLHTLSTVMPAFLIAFICVFSLFLACGIFYGRRRRLMLLRHMPPGGAPRHAVVNDTLAMVGLGHLETLGAAAQGPRKKKKKLARPKLWEVRVREKGGWAVDWDVLEPVAVELQTAPRSKSEDTRQRAADRLRRANNWGDWHLLPRPLRSDEVPSAPPKNAPAQQAQVSLLVAMPAPARPSREYVLGTTLVPYREAEPDSSDDEEDEEVARVAVPRRAGGMPVPPSVLGA